MVMTSKTEQAQIELTEKPNDKHPHRKKQQKAKGDGKWQKKQNQS